MTTPSILSNEELAPLLQRKRQLQADLASQHQSSCGSGGCCGSQSSCASSTSAAPSPATGQQPNVLKALLIAGSVLAVVALAWWA